MREHKEGSADCAVGTRKLPACRVADSCALTFLSAVCDRAAGPPTGPYRPGPCGPKYKSTFNLSFSHLLKKNLSLSRPPEVQSPESPQRRERDEGGIVVGGRGVRWGQRSEAAVDGEAVRAAEAVSPGPAHRLRGLPRRRLRRRRSHAPRT